LVLSPIIWNDIAIQNSFFGRYTTSMSVYDQKMHCFSVGGFSLAVFEHLNAFANSGIFETVPSTRYRVGECGSVRMRCTAAAGFIALAHMRAKEMKNNCSLTRELGRWIQFGRDCVGLYLVKFRPGKRYSPPSLTEV